MHTRYAPPVVTDRASIDAAVRRESLRMAMHNSSRSVPLQLVAVAFFVVLGVEVHLPGVAVLIAACGIAVAAWRYSLSRRYGNVLVSDDAELVRLQHELEGNATLGGVMWAIGTVTIYPHLGDTTATAFVVTICGSIAIAAFFMSLVGRSFLILCIFQLGGLVTVSLFNVTVRSWPLAILAAIFGLTMYRAAIEFRNTTTRALRHGLEADAASESLLIAKDAAEAANMAKSQFLATMSHEIRTPMNGVLGALDLLRHSTLDADQRRLVRTAVSSGTSLMEILNDVLDHSKIEAGKLILASDPTSLHNMVRAVVALFRSNAEAKGVELTAQVDAEAADWVLADSQRLKQVLLNLVGNAIKFTEKGAVSLALKGGRAFDDAAEVCFEVRDFGHRHSGQFLLRALPAISSSGRQAERAARRHRPGPGDQPANRQRDGRCDFGSKRAWRRLALRFRADLSGGSLVRADRSRRLGDGWARRRSLPVRPRLAGRGQRGQSHDREGSAGLARSRCRRGDRRRRGARIAVDADRRSHPDGLPDAGDGRLRGGPGSSVPWKRRAGRRDCPSWR